MTPASAQQPLRTWQAMPKVLLHEHLDGGLRPQTLLDLCRERGVPLPATNAAGLAAWVQANANSGSLERYLQGFGLTVAAMATAEACERVAFEAADDARLDGCVLAEFRIAPLLLEPFGLSGEAAVEAMLSGLRRSGLACGLIVCAMRTDPPDHTLRSARLAARYAGQGVIGFDLAGAERGFPPGPHAQAFAEAGRAGLGLTCHAGEADDGARVLEAAALGASRIGHGVNIMRPGATLPPPQLIDEARHLCLHFEVCPTSNLHTGAAEALAGHPIAAMVQAGLSVSCSTDNRLMSGVSLSGELAAVHRHCGLSAAQITAMMCSAAEASFMPAEARVAALQALQRWSDNPGPGLSPSAHPTQDPSS
jgi:adenosine deaminase